jgi:hypothetical protein
MEERIYNMNEEIKTVVVSIEQYRCRVNLDNPFYGDKIDKEFILKRAEDKAAYDLLDGIKQFIKVSRHLDRGYIESEIFLPYVRDSKIKELEGTADFMEKAIRRRDIDIIDLEKTIRLLKRPWWKKLFKITP